MRSVLICIAFILASLNGADRQQGLPLVTAGYQRCVNVNPGTLEKPVGITLYPNRKDVA